VAHDKSDVNGKHAFHASDHREGRGFRRTSSRPPVHRGLAGFGYEKCVLDLRRGSDSVNDDSVLCGEILVVPSPRNRGDIGMNIWTEFKNAILPWLLAGAVVAFMIAEHRRTTAALLDANTRLAHAVEDQGKALDGVRALLGSQGYTLPPLSKPQ
jgi:hypothetical protein